MMRMCSLRSIEPQARSNLQAAREAFEEDVPAKRGDFFTIILWNVLKFQWILWFSSKFYLKISLSGNLRWLVIIVLIMIGSILAFVKFGLLYISYRLDHTICFLSSSKLCFLCTTKNFISRPKEILWQ